MKTIVLEVLRTRPALARRYTSEVISRRHKLHSTRVAARYLVPDRLKWRDGAEIRMLYDGECPLCMREVNMLMRRDKHGRKIDFVDISATQYSSESNANISYKEAMEEIHAILPDGRIVTNVEVFRRLYEAVGLGWVYAVTKFGPISIAANWLYGIWARFRLPLTGRSDLQTVLSEKKRCKAK